MSPPALDAAIRAALAERLPDLAPLEAQRVARHIADTLRRDGWLTPLNGGPPRHRIRRAHPNPSTPV